MAYISRHGKLQVAYYILPILYDDHRAGSGFVIGLVWKWWSVVGHTSCDVR